MKKEKMISKLVHALKKGYSPKRIVLFGSYAWGRPDEHSDIDLFILKETKKKPPQRFVTVQKILYGFHAAVPVEPLVLTSKELKKRMQLGDPFILRILKEGKILYGE